LAAWDAHVLLYASRRLLAGTRIVAAATSQHLGQHFLGLLGKSTIQYGANGVLDRILDAFQLDAVVFDDGVSGALVAIAGLADTARIDHELAVYFEHVLLVRVPDADDLGFHVRQSPGPEIRIGRSIFVERIAWRGVNEEEARAVQRRRYRDWQARQVAQVFIAEPFARERPSHSGEVLEARPSGHSHVLGYRVIVVAAD